jgi:DNA-binding protein YbaB
VALGTHWLQLPIVAATIRKMQEMLAELSVTGTSLDGGVKVHLSKAGSRYEVSSSLLRKAVTSEHLTAALVDAQQKVCPTTANKCYNA